ncbi:MAG: amidohydrolase family protein [Chloroflexi bacterium]|nr:amidohydrolase family protein [Chloroflexota bacterium]
MTAPPNPDTRPLVLIGGTVFDDDARTFRRADAVCREGRIEALAESVTAPQGALAIDCSGKYLLPGLIDCHVHITGSGDPTELNTANTTPLATRAWRAARYAEQTLMAGFTTVRDLGAADQLNIHLASAIESGLLRGPRMLAAGLGITMTGGHGSGFIATEADGPDAVRKAVRQQLRSGATAIKLFASGGVMTPGVDPRSPSFTEDELRAGVEEAHKAFRIVGAHAQATEGVKNAIRAGVDSIEHGFDLDDEAVADMKKQGTFLVPTLALLDRVVNTPGVPEYAKAKARPMFDTHVESFKRAVKAGVKIGSGSDAFSEAMTAFGPYNLREIELLQENGLGALGALKAATSSNAELLGNDTELGSIDAGKLADILIVRGDLTESLSALMDPDNIVVIMQGGRVIPRLKDCSPY